MLCSAPALFCFLLTARSELKYRNTFRLPGNALAVVCDVPTNVESAEPAPGIIVSIDTIHKPGSTIERRCSTDDSINPLQCFVSQGCGLAQGQRFEPPDQMDVSENSSTGRLTNLLYNLENLRKSSAGTQEEE
jgi:tRNA (guanine-N(7)-)-methyltransferase subunit TRM82